jgi:CRISPR-associated protein Cmr2
MEWGKALELRTKQVLNAACTQNKWQPIEGRIVYAGGDDFFGILYRNPEDGAELTPRECIEGFWYQFNDLWNQCEHNISVSTGFVWAAPSVPQRDLLQHLRTTEKLAKTEGRDRLAIRILFNSGNYLDWSCPWRFLQPLFESYRDRDNKNQNWTHLYTDIATLESRHAFSNDDSSIAQGIFDIYFPNFKCNDDPDWWNQTSSDTPSQSLQGEIIPMSAVALEASEDAPYQRLQGGLLGDRPNRVQEQHQRRNQWIINLAKVGFHLFS